MHYIFNHIKFCVSSLWRNADLLLCFLGCPWRDLDKHILLLIPLGFICIYTANTMKIIPWFYRCDALKRECIHITASHYSSLLGRFTFFWTCHSPGTPFCIQTWSLIRNHGLFKLPEGQGCRQSFSWQDVIMFCMN